MQLRVEAVNVASSVAVFESNNVTELEELTTQTKSAFRKSH